MVNSFGFPNSKQSNEIDSLENFDQFNIPQHLQPAKITSNISTICLTEAEDSPHAVINCYKMVLSEQDPKSALLEPINLKDRKQIDKARIEGNLLIELVGKDGKSAFATSKKGLLFLDNVDNVHVCDENGLIMKTYDKESFNVRRFTHLEKYYIARGYFAQLAAEMVRKRANDEKKRAQQNKNHAHTSIPTPAQVNIQKESKGTAKTKNDHLAIRREKRDPKDPRITSKELFEQQSKEIEKEREKHKDEEFICEKFAIHLFMTNKHEREKTEEHKEIAKQEQNQQTIQKGENAPPKMNWVEKIKNFKDEDD